MTYLYIVSLLLNIFSILKKRKNYVIFISVLFFVILMGGSTIDADWDGYASLYATSATNTLKVEPGFNTLQKVFVSLGLSYADFRVILSLICFSLLYFILNLFLSRGSFSLILLCYSLYSVYYDSIQIRNFIGFLFVLLGTFYLCFSKKDNTTLFIIFVILGATFHITMIAYLIFLAIKSKYKNLVLFFVILISGASIFLTIINGMSIPYLDLFLSVVPGTGEKLLTYTDQKTRFGVLLPLLLQLISILYSFILENYVNRNEGSMKPKIFRLKYLNLVSLVFIPFCLINLNFYRYIRNIVLLNLVMGQVVLNQEKNDKNKIALICITLVYVLVWFLYSFVFSREWGSVITPLFEGNRWLP